MRADGHAATQGRCNACQRLFFIAFPERRRCNHTQPCAMGCGNNTRRPSGICRVCSGLKPLKGYKWSGNPEHCPTCGGLPWRRGENQHGERVADTCPKCGLPWEPEPVLPIEAHLRGTSNIVERV